MNIIDDLPFKPDKPAVSIIRNTEKSMSMAIGLLKNQVLPKHTTPVPTTLIMIDGTIAFDIEGKKTILNDFDTFEIPVDIEHHVTGLEDRNVFVLFKEK